MVIGNLTIGFEVTLSGQSVQPNDQNNRKTEPQKTDPFLANLVMLSTGCDKDVTIAINL